MEKTIKCSLWLVPEQDTAAYQTLSQLIADIGRVFSSPVFEPHVTLLGGMEGTREDILRKSKKLSAMLNPYDVHLAETGSNGTYFQAFFVRVRQTQPVMKANKSARAAFGFVGPKYFPHLSFAYGDFGKKDIAQMQRMVDRRSDLSDVWDFPIYGLQVWHTEGQMSEWECIEHFSFSN